MRYRFLDFVHTNRFRGDRSFLDFTTLKIFLVSNIFCILYCLKDTKIKMEYNIWIHTCVWWSFVRPALIYCKRTFSSMIFCKCLASSQGEYLNISHLALRYSLFAKFFHPLHSCDETFVHITLLLLLLNSTMRWEHCIIYTSVWCWILAHHWDENILYYIICLCVMKMIVFLMCIKC